MRKTAAAVFLFVYKAVSGVWRGLIFNFWGIISECQHRPTCSEYMAEQIKVNGWRGVGRGIKRLLSCR